MGPISNSVCTVANAPSRPGVGESETETVRWGEVEPAKLRSAADLRRVLGGCRVSRLDRNAALEFNAAFLRCDEVVPQTAERR